MSSQQSMSAELGVSGRRQLRFGWREQWLLLKAGLVACDAAALGTAIAIAYIIRFKAGIPFLETPPYSVSFYSSVAFWSVPVTLALLGLYRLYDRQHLFGGIQEYIQVINACTAGILAVIVMSFLDVTLQISRGWLLLAWALSVVLVCWTRFALRRAVRALRSAGFLTTPTLIVGSGEEACAIAEQLSSDPGSGTRIMGFVANGPARGSTISCGLSVLGGLGDLNSLITERGIREVVVATTGLSRDELLDLYRRLGHVENIELRLSSGLFEILTTGVRVQEISCVPLMTPQRVRITGVDALLKGALDYIGAALGLVFLSPILAVIAFLIRIDSPGPILHRRRVMGRAGRAFDAFKFRTMVVNADQVLAENPALRDAFDRDYKLKADPRVTRVGGFLRRTSLDELPQLINVLRGEMSLVGPRMVAPDEAPRYGKWQLNLLTVKPGITGPWQVRGRSDIPYEERIRLSMHYIRNYSIWVDLEILLRTIPAVLGSRGAY